MEGGDQSVRAGRVVVTPVTGKPDQFDGDPMKFANSRSRSNLGAVD